MGSGLVQERVMNAISVGQSGTKYSDSVLTRISKGYQAARILTTAGSITANLQVSIDNANWYTPVDISGNTIGTICTALTVNTSTKGTYIEFSSVVAPYCRIMVVENNSAPTVVTIDLIFVESV